MANGGASRVYAPWNGHGRLGQRSDHADQRGTGPERGPLPVRRRAGGPGGRAVLGGLLVATALVGLFATATSGGNSGKSYVVAGRPIAAGTRLQPADLTSVRLRLSPALRTRAFSREATLLGSTLLAPLSPGELVQAGAVVRGPAEAPTREESFTVERGQISPGLIANVRVDVLATYGTGNEAFTTAVVRRARVVSLDRSRGGMADGPTVVTVALESSSDALALAHATALGKITVVRAPGAEPATGEYGVYRPVQQEGGR